MKVKTDNQVWKNQETSETQDVSVKIPVMEMEKDTFDDVGDWLEQNAPELLEYLMATYSTVKTDDGSTEKINGLMGALYRGLCLDARKFYGPMGKASVGNTDDLDKQVLDKKITPKEYMRKCLELQKGNAKSKQAWRIVE
jgi:hypothetical protein